jgi:hypothetical protein
VFVDKRDYHGSRGSSSRAKKLEAARLSHESVGTGGCSAVAL